MDEVDGMSAGDRGGVADLIASIKISKIPIICICNDRYSQKLKSLMNYCLQINFQKPTKQQVHANYLSISINHVDCNNSKALIMLTNVIIYFQIYFTFMCFLVYVGQANCVNKMCLSSRLYFNNEFYFVNM